ncbi:MAG: phosphatidate cytidylyltransferase [Flavobacterium sp.]
MNESVVRTLSGIVYIALLVTATLFSPESFIILFGIFMLIAVHEFSRLVQVGFVNPMISASVLFLCNAVNVFADKINGVYLEVLFVSVALFVNIKLIYDLFNKKQLIPKSANMSRLELMGYITFSFLLLIRLPFNGDDFQPSIIIGIFILIWTNDTFAYIVGKTMGRHKLLERISPKKTVEGFLGGLVFAIIGSYIISCFDWFGMSTLLWVSTAIILVITGTLGDLIESRFKRNAGVKDSGNIMPGHGGILDRLDSIIFAIPFLFLFYQIINYVS